MRPSARPSEPAAARPNSRRRGVSAGGVIISVRGFFVQLLRAARTSSSALMKSANDTSGIVATSSNGKRVTHLAQPGDRRSGPSPRPSARIPTATISDQTATSVADGLAAPGPWWMHPLARGVD